MCLLKMLLKFIKKVKIKDKWRNQEIITSFIEIGERSFYQKTFVSASDNPVIEVLENGSFYWFASALSTNSLFYVSPHYSNVAGADIGAAGIRPLVSLQSDILLEPDGQTEGEWNQWKIVGSAN